MIRNMTATFGKLDQDSVSFYPGLNIIYAPNESGKSTWCHFIRTMLYGLPTRDRGASADKNRFAPWSGAAMRGRMELEADGEKYTVVRDTLRSASPMASFSCTYTGTATDIPDITSQNLGEKLLGIGRDVFVRSAFIGQSGLALDQDAELERRIAALVSSGQEDISFSESYDRLKKQLSRRKHNKTGTIPALEHEVAQLTDALQHLQSLQMQETAAKEQVQQFTRQTEDIRQRLAQWEALQKQEALRRCLLAEQQVKTAETQLSSLKSSFGALPDATELARLDGTAVTLDQTLSDAQSAEHTAQEKQQAAAIAHAALQQHPLYPADESQLNAKLRTMTPKRFSPWVAVLILLLGSGMDLALWFLLSPSPLLMLVGASAVVVSLYIYNIIRRKNNRVIASKRAQLQADIQAYSQLQQQYHAAQAAAEHATLTARGLHDNCRQGLLQLLGHVQAFAPQATNLTNVRGALEQAIEHRARLDRAQQAVREAQLQAQFLRARLPQGPFPHPHEVLPHPATSYAQLQDALPRAIANTQSAQSRLDRLTGQLHAAGDRDALESRLYQKEQQLLQAQREYEALTVAMGALERADLAMQSRFSPALGQRAAQIFSAFTGGKYHKVLLHRDFSLSAESQGEITPHSIQQLSQGAADQLYLAVRLAICDMVLPAEKNCPIILDDALANFDDTRLHSALDWLAEESKHRQILLFTCQKRESNYFSHHDNVHLLSL
ncbi:MAG: hypothetical protein E7446_05965 [Ruminococcaceae bacterium]|nr:hypothetical protein [Oscillospiraceae bacterium]